MDSESGQEPNSASGSNQPAPPQPRGLIEKWLEYTENLTSPRQLRLWTILSAIGSAAKRSIWTEVGENVIYPNLFVFLVAPPGVGKCLAPDEPVLMHDGSVKLTRDLLVGDKVMGPDSAPRNVLATTPGRGQMVRIVPVKGRPFKCNWDHILSLKQSSGPEHGKVYHMTVRDYLQLPSSRRDKLKLWRTGVDFPEQPAPTVDPYFAGLLLGDGSIRDCVQITSIEPEIFEYVQEQAVVWGLRVVPYEYENKAPRVGLSSTNGSNPLLNALRALGMSVACEHKSIPDAFKLGSREVRLQTLAGLMDTDGSYVPHGNCYDFISKSKQLAADVTFIARSLGIAAYMKPAYKSCQTGNGDWYYRVTLSGAVDQIPCKLRRKQARPRSLNKDPLVTGFRIEPIGEGDWFGIVLDGDHQYLLDDFTVTHNTQALKPAIELLGRSDAVKLLASDVSKASLLDNLSQCSEAVRYKDTQGNLQLVDYHYGALIVTELSQFMSKYDGTIAGLLTDLFDCLPIYKEEKRSGQSVGTIVNPGLSVLVGTATGHLGSVITPELWDSGFMARVILVYSADKVRPKNMWAKSGDKSSLKAELVKDFSRFKGSLQGPMDWSEEAKNLIWSWRCEAEDEAPIHNKLTHYMTRRWFHLAKLCMVSALSDHRMQVVEYDFWRGVEWLLEAESVMPEIFKDMISHADGEVFEDLKAQFFNTFVKGGKKPMPVTWLYDFLKNRTSVNNIERMIKTAEGADIIRRVAGTSGDDAMYVPGDMTKRAWT